MSRRAIHIIKVGGNVVEDASMLNPFLESIAGLEGDKILVHGGGKEASTLAARMNVEVQMKEGRRITNDAMIDIVIMTYAGLVNKRIVAKLQAMGCACVGLTGADGNVILSKKRPVREGIDYGWVGDPVDVHRDFLISLLQQGIFPILAPLTHDGQGHMLNTNADTIASVVGQALAQSYDVHQVYAFELPGVMKDLNDPASLVRNIDGVSYQELRQQGFIRDGMIPKLDNAFDALDKGVRSVALIRYDQIRNLSDPNFDEYTRVV